MINEVLTATCSQHQVETAKNRIPNRSLLYNKDKEALFIKYEDQLFRLGMLPDMRNIVVWKDEKDREKIALKDYIDVNGITVHQPGSDEWKALEPLGTITPVRNVLLLFPDLSDDYIGGELAFISTSGKNVSHYHISFTNETVAKPALLGGTTFEKKAILVSGTYKGKPYYGIQEIGCTEECQVFFTGWYRREKGDPIAVRPGEFNPVKINTDDGSGGGGGGAEWEWKYGDTYQVLAESEKAARRNLPEGHIWQLTKVDFRIGEILQDPDEDKTIKTI